MLYWQPRSFAGSWERRSNGGFALPLSVTTVPTLVSGIFTIAGLALMHFEYGSIRSFESRASSVIAIVSAFDGQRSPTPSAHSLTEPLGAFVAIGARALGSAGIGEDPKPLKCGTLVSAWFGFVCNGLPDYAIRSYSPGELPSFSQPSFKRLKQ